jgi:Uma2 family endonuclease
VSAQPQVLLTPEQYLEIERAAPFRSEYYEGRMYAMSGGTFSHGRIILNLAGDLNSALKKTPCSTVVNDVRVRVAVDGLYTYPDIVVVCGEPKFAEGQSDTLLNPMLLIEVLSPSTEGYDRGFKFAQYSTLETLKEYTLASQTEARVEVFRLQENRWVLTEYVGLETSCHFESLDRTVALADIYDKVKLGLLEPGLDRGQNL